MPPISKKMTNQLSSLAPESLELMESSQDQVIASSLPDPIAKNIEAITSLHAQEVQNIANHQKVIERIAAFFGQSIFLYILLVIFAVWIGSKAFDRFLPFHFPPFEWQNEGLSASGLLITTGVLVRQSREERFSEQRTQLMLHLMLVSEQKIAKSIALLEELRTDLPNVMNRRDPEAQAMKESTDPIVVLESLKQTLAQELSSTDATLNHLKDNMDKPNMVESSKLDDLIGKPDP